MRLDKSVSMWFTVSFMGNDKTWFPYSSLDLSHDRFRVNTGCFKTVIDKKL